MRVALFAPRRMGKTHFLLKDITPLAKQNHINIFYFSFMSASNQIQSLFQNAPAQFTYDIQSSKKAVAFIGGIIYKSGREYPTRFTHSKEKTTFSNFTLLAFFLHQHAIQTHRMEMMLSLLTFAMLNLQSPFLLGGYVTNLQFSRYQFLS